MQQTEKSTSAQQSLAVGVESSPSTPTLQIQDRIGIVLALLTLYLIWGSTYLGMRIAVGSFPPFIMSGIRYILAGGLLYLFLLAKKVPHPSRAEWIGSAVVGVLLIGGGNGSVSFAEQWVQSGIAAVAIAATPLWTALFMGLFGRWPSRLEWFGLALGFAGVILLNLENGLWANPLGAGALLLAPICWSFGSALSARRLTLPTGLMASAAQMLLGGIFMLFVSVLLGEHMQGPPSLQSVGAMAYLILFGSIVAFSAYGYLLRRVRPALATSYAYVNPIVAVCLGMLLVNEKITLVGVLAMFVILTGVALVSLRKKH